MSNSEKQEIIKSLMPMAVIKAVSEKAKESLHHLNHDRDFISIYEFPFLVGREARTEFVNGQLKVMERRRFSEGEPNNHLYLVDREKLLQISRQHFTIKQKNTGFTLFDRGSACGLTIDKQHIGGKDKGGEFPLKDGDIFGIGKQETPYLFKFIVL